MSRPEPQSEITKEQFSSWKRDPVTARFFYDLAREVVGILDEELPTSADVTVAVAHQREGMKTTAEYVFDWEPVLAREAQDDA